MRIHRRITMLKPRLVQVGTFAVLAVAVTAPRGALLAQGAQSVQGGQPTVQLAFGYECDDRFLVRNDGAQTVTVEYGVSGAQQRSSLDLKGNEAMELASTSNEPLELWVGGKLVATERKGNVPCEAQNTAVVVRPIMGQDYGTYVEPAYYAAPVVYVRPIYGYGYGYGYDYGYGYGYGYGYRPTVRVVAPFVSQFGGGYAGHGRAVNGAGYRGDQGRGSGRGVRVGEPARVAHVSGSGYAPRAGGSGYAPRAGGSGYAPRAGGSGYAPRAGGSGYAPRAGGSGQAPRAGGSGHAPRAGGSGQAPRAGGSGRGEHSGGTARGAQAGNHGHHG
jgi:hypothetical protein